MRNASLSVSVLPIRRLPWLGMPMMSPGQASSARPRGKTPGLHRHQAPGADVLQLHAAPKTARRDPHNGDAVAMLRVDIGLHLEDEPATSGSSGEIGRGPLLPWAGCGRGAAYGL